MDQQSFSTIYEKLLKGKVSVEEAEEYMKSPQVRRTINVYINKEKINNLVPYSEEDLQNIQMIINIAQFIYNNSGEETGLSDTEYDILYAIMLANGGTDITSVPILPNNKNIEYHKYPDLRGSLKKVYYLTKDEERTNPSRQYLDEWKSSMENKYFQNTGKHINLDDLEVYVFPKFDGVSGIFEYDENGNLLRVLTRGYTETNEAENITIHFKNDSYGEKVNKSKKAYGMKTEIMMMEKDLKFYNEKYHTDYKQTRSIVSAIINSDEYDPVKSSLLHVVPLRLQYEDGRQMLTERALNGYYPSLKCKFGDREQIRKFAHNNAYVNEGLRCDGAVIYIIDEDVQKALGREDNKNNWEVAYKFTEESCLTKLEDINFNVGLFGRLAPVAKIKPVKLKGNTIENISLGSIGRLKDLHLRKGDKVKVLYDIIPYLSFDYDCEHNMDGKEFKIPKVCPECGEELEFSESGDIASCVNTECPCRIKGKILNYLGKMNIDNISYGAIDKLYEYEIVTCIEDLYKIKDHIHEISNIDGLGIKTAKIFKESIESVKDVYDWMLLGSLGIESISKKTFEKIMQVYNIEELLDIASDKSIGKLVSLHGVQEKSAIKIIEGINQNKKLIKFLMKELNVIESKGLQQNTKFSVCFTNFKEVEKKEPTKLIEKYGGSVVDSVTKDTTILLTPNHSVESSKMTKAKKYGTLIFTLDELNNYLSSL